MEILHRDVLNAKFVVPELQIGGAKTDCATTRKAHTLDVMPALLTGAIVAQKLAFVALSRR